MKLTHFPNLGFIQIWWWYKEKRWHDYITVSVSGILSLEELLNAPVSYLYFASRSNGWRNCFIREMLITIRLTFVYMYMCLHWLTHVCHALTLFTGYMLCRPVPVLFRQCQWKIQSIHSSKNRSLNYFISSKCSIVNMHELCWDKQHKTGSKFLTFFTISPLVVWAAVAHIEAWNAGKGETCPAILTWIVGTCI